MHSFELAPPKKKEVDKNPESKLSELEDELKGSQTVPSSSGVQIFVEFKVDPYLKEETSSQL